MDLPLLCSRIAKNKALIVLSPQPVENIVDNSRF